MRSPRGVVAVRHWSRRGRPVQHDGLSEACTHWDCITPRPGPIEPDKVPGQTCGYITHAAKRNSWQCRLAWPHDGQHGRG